MAMKMGLQLGLDRGKTCKRENRWLFSIAGVSADFSPTGGVNALPPQKSARPTLAFKEMVAQHLIEEVYYPAKPEWRPVNLVLYDLKRNLHPVFEWIKNVYDPNIGSFYEPNRQSFIKQCNLTLYDGCGNTVETWAFEDVWPQQINFMSLDMASSGIIMCELTLRYVRAYIM